MSKNVVDAVIDSDGDFGFIPSRRQVDYNGGYVNNWTTGEFAKYVNGRALIQRDHGGIGQVINTMVVTNHLCVILNILIYYT